MKFNKVYSKKKPYSVPAVITYPGSFEVWAMKEWKMFYSAHRKREHDQKYGCGLEEKV